MREALAGFIAPDSADAELVRRIDFDRLPRHVAVIMDGNGRWAAQRNLSRIEGHKAGAAAVRETVEAAARIGLEVLTLYAFSRENWKRPPDEVAKLWRLLRDTLKKQDKVLQEHSLRLRVIGRRDGVPPPVRREMERVERETAGNRRMTVVLALNYGGRDEIVDAARALLREGADPATLDEAAFAGRLSTAGLPDPDLLIRTSQELRISNFLLWQCAYTELWFTPVLWPDFRRTHLLEAVADFQRRERRYGDVGSSRPAPAGAARPADPRPRKG